MSSANDKSQMEHGEHVKIYQRKNIKKLAYTEMRQKLKI